MPSPYSLQTDNKRQMFNNSTQAEKERIKIIRNDKKEVKRIEWNVVGRDKSEGKKLRKSESELFSSFSLSSFLTYVRSVNCTPARQPFSLSCTSTARHTDSRLG